MIRLVCILAALLALVACGSGPLKLLTGSGPNVAANVQAGKTNAQTVGTATFTEQKLVRPQARTIRQSSDANKVQAEAVQQVVVNEGAPWHLVYVLIVMCLIFLALPSVGQMWRAIRKPKGQHHGIHSL